jgi:hypothetical protein
MVENSLESRAKTTRQVIDTTLGTENWDLKGLGITEVKVDFEKPLWVTLEEAQNFESKTNDELMHYKEENYDQLHEIAFLREDLIDAKQIFIAALDRAKLEAQPQDMNTRLTFTFDELQGLQRALSLCVEPSKEEKSR